MVIIYFFRDSSPADTVADLFLQVSENAHFSPICLSTISEINQLNCTSEKFQRNLSVVRSYLNIHLNKIFLRANIYITNIINYV